MKRLKLLEEENAEPVEAGVLDGEPVLRFVHPEAARSTRAGGEEHVIVDNVLARQPLGFERLQVLDQVADHEVGRIALTVVVLEAAVNAVHPAALV